MYGLTPPLVFLSLNSGFGSGPYKGALIPDVNNFQVQNFKAYLTC